MQRRDGPKGAGAARQPPIVEMVGVAVARLLVSCVILAAPAG
jgi:hypothetical protein